MEKKRLGRQSRSGGNKKPESKYYSGANTPNQGKGNDSKTVHPNQNGERRRLDNKGGRGGNKLRQKSQMMMKTHVGGTRCGRRIGVGRMVAGSQSRGKGFSLHTNCPKKQWMKPHTTLALVEGRRRKLTRKGTAGKENVQGIENGR